MLLSIVIPAYNEAKNLEELTERFYKVLKKQKINFEIIYVIQGTDGAFEKLKKLHKGGKKELKIYYYPKPLGVGPAFKIGFNKISPGATHVLTMDADLNHQPEEFPKFLEKMQSTDADIIIGSRKIKGGKMERMPLMKKMISGFVNILLPLLFISHVKDLTSGYRLFKKKVISSIKDEISSKNFEFYPEVLLLARRKEFKMKEIPITFKYRIHGESKLNFMTSGVGYAKLMFKYFFKRKIRKPVVTR